MSRRALTATVTGWLGNRISIGIGLVLCLLLVGVSGYMLIEGWTFSDALFMTVITISTVGYGEVHPLSPAGRLFTSMLIVFGVGVLFYALTNLVSFVVEGQLALTLGRRRMLGKIARLSEHFVLCGFGRVGDAIAREFMEQHIPFVVLDNNPAAIAHAADLGYLYLEGDAADDEMLKAAGIKRAQGLIAAGDSDASNTYITLSAKSLRPDLFVIARVGTPNNEAKLRRAGADRVISPYTLAGHRMALAASRPFMVDFIDALRYGRQGTLLAEIDVKPQTRLANTTLAQACAGATTVTVLAVQRPNGELIVGPHGNTGIEAGDQLIVIGDEEEVRALG